MPYMRMGDKFIRDGTGGITGFAGVAVYPTAAYSSICQMDAEKSIVTYSTGAESTVNASCLTLNGDVITAGPSYIIAYNTVYETSVCAMDSTHAIMIWNDNTASTIYACCLTLSGTAITPGPAVVVHSSSYNFKPDITAMDSTHAIVSYTDGLNSYSGTARCLTLSGTTVLVNAPCAYETNAFNNSVCTLDSSNAVVLYYDNDTGIYCARCLSLSGTAITAGPSVSLGALGATMEAAVCEANSGQAIALYNGTSGGMAQCLTLSGTTLTAGAALTFAPDINTASYGLSVCNMNPKYSIASYRDIASPTIGNSCVLSVSGTSVVKGGQFTYEVSGINYPSICMMNPRYAITAAVKNIWYLFAYCLKLS